MALLFSHSGLVKRNRRLFETSILVYRGGCVWLYSGVDELWWLVVLMRGIRDDVSVMHVTAGYCRVHSYIPDRNMFTPAIAV